MIYLASILSISPALVAAALYPTLPTNHTVFYPSTTRANVIRWMDDGKDPTLSQLGNMRIDLILENKIVATLARSIPCTYREVKLYVPPGIGPDSSDYALVFVPSWPYTPVYSARFTISNHTSDSSPPHMRINPAVSPTSTFSPIISTETSGGTSTVTSARSTSTFVPGREKIGTTASGSHRVRIESTARFRAMYVLWPVLVGAALAS